MPELHYADYTRLVELIDSLPEDECHPDLLETRERLVACANFMARSDS